MADPPASMIIPVRMPFGVHVRGQELWITSVATQRIYVIDEVSSGSFTLRTITGRGKLGSEPTPVDASQAAMNWPHEVWVGDGSTHWIADTRNDRIAEVSGDPPVFRILAGGDDAGFDQPHSVIRLDAHSLLVADTKNHRLCQVHLPDGDVTRFGGDGRRKRPTPGVRVDQTSLFGPRALAVSEDAVWLALREGNSIWRIDRQTKVITLVAGTGEKGYSGDGGDPLQATFNGPKGLCMDSKGRLLVVDTENHCVRRIDLVKETIETVLGGSTEKETLPLKRPHGIAAESSGDGFWVADSENHRIIGWQLSHGASSQ
ncbi:MAG: NHL repeat-containing protein [Planctomycetota bacterium]